MGEDLTDALARVHAARNTANAYAKGINPQQAANITQVAVLYPNLGAAVVPLGASGAPDRVVQKAAAVKTRSDSRRFRPGSDVSGGWMKAAWNAVKDHALKPVVRYGTAGAMFPYEWLQQSARVTFGGNYNPMSGDAGKAVFQGTTVGAGITEAHDRGQLGKMLLGRGDEKVSGDGWFIGLDSVAGKRQVREARTAALIDGRAATLGRAAATYLTPLDAGTTGYNVVSGVVDIASGLFLDPVTYIGGGVAKASRARNVISTGPVREVELPTKVMRPGTPLVRQDVADANLTPSAKPQGVYFSIDREGFTTPFEEYGDTAHRRLGPLLDDPSILRPPPAKIESRGLRAGTGMELPVDAGVSALKHLLSDDEFAAVVAEARRGKAHFAVHMAEKYPDIEWGRYYDPLEMLGAYGGLVARERGHKGIFLKDDLFSDHDEFVALTDDIVSGPPGSATSLDAGLIDGNRKTVLPEKAIAWLDSKPAGDAITKIAAEKDFERLRRATGKKLPVSLLVQLVDADDPVTVKNLIAEAISQGAVREKMVYKAKRDDPARILGMMPGSKIDLDDMDDAVEQLDRFQRNVRMTPEQISRNNLALARAGSAGERFQVVKTVLHTVREGLETAGVPKHRARTLTQAFSDAYDDSRRYFVDAVGDNANVPGAVIGGTGKPLPSPHLSTELIDRYVPLPNARDLKAATRDHAVVSKIQGSLGYTFARDFADFVTNDLFKTFALALRPAWTVRVVGEEQFRMGAAGMSSAFHHPLSYLAWVAGEKPGRLNKIMQGGRGGTDALGKSFADDVAEGITDFQQSLNRGSAGWRNRVNVAARHWTTYAPDEEPYIASWHDELTQLMSAPEAREVARNGADHTKRLFWSGNLQGERKKMQAANPRMGLDDMSGANRYIDSVFDRIHIKTGGHPDLIAAIGTGKVGDHPLMLGLAPNPKALKALEALRGEGIGPKVVKGKAAAGADESGTEIMARHYDRAAEAAFHALGSVPSNKLSRSIVFRQSYWKRVEELAPMLAKNDRARLARQAKDAGLDKNTVARLRATVDEPRPDGTLSLEDADRVAKAFGLGETRRLLYSLHDKSQAADALRVVFPFGEAWREVLTRWTMLGKQNPLVPYRAAQALSEGEGVFFAPDPMTGEEMIHIPGSEWITDKLTGVPMRLDMPLKGLNMFGQVLPGVGPVVSVPAGMLIPEDPGADWLRDMILPYGETDVSSGALESFFPAYLKKLAGSVGWQSPAAQRQIASTTRDVMAFLYSTGEYDLSTPDGQDRLVEDAKGKAMWLYRIRAIAQSTSPAAPTSKFSAVDKDGRLTAMFKLAEDYRRMQDQDFRTATERFLNKYGDGAFLAVIGKTSGTVAPTDTVNRLARTHPEVARKFPTVFGYFAPGGEVDPGEIERQIEAGTRELVGPEKAVATANIRLAASIYSQAVTRAGDRVDEEERAWLRDVKDRLKKDFPGYTGGFDSTKGEGSVQELIRAAGDETLKSTPAGEALGIYLQARGKAIEATRAQGLAGPFEAQAARPWRDWLRGVAAKLVADHPEFADMYDYVLAREMTEDDR